VPASDLAEPDHADLSQRDLMAPPGSGDSTGPRDGAGSHTRARPQASVRAPE
jgi:hypothetical protein